MKAAIIAIIVILVLGAIAATAYVFLAPKEEVNQPATTLFPSSTGGSTTVDPSSRRVALSDGSYVVAKDFVNNGVTFEDPANEGTYYVAGTLDYCLEDGSCPSTGTTGFAVLYLEEGQEFLIALTEEPLGEMRVRAEQYLKATLGLSDAEMCALKYSVGTSVSVNRTYGSISNLKFSFCPDAIALP